ncbi:hypothetical protein AcW1_008156 [Taiwanofungus camphoratus]|nr:hypothetical protein AcW1_008156 [Antrodia cinnamomea]
MTSIIPTEVFERIIDLYDTRALEDRNALMACALTCRSWLPRSRYRLFYSVKVSSLQERGRFSNLITASPSLNDLVRELDIGADSYGARVKVLGSFPYVLARRLTQVVSLHIVFDLTRDAPSVLPSFPILVSEFTSITKLEMRGVRFSTFTDFGRLVCALPSLRTLICSSVTWRKSEYRPYSFR